jgi:hypothetical protein
MEDEPPEKQPGPETLRARWQLIESRFGRWGRLRSWATVLVGLLALGLLAWWIGAR